MASAVWLDADAAFSACGQYRWWLTRTWDPTGAPLVFIGLNPSLADGQRDDPTLRRIVRFARQWGHGSVIVLNLFARISPSPAVLRRCSDPVGAETDAWLRRAAQQGLALWLGWGNHGAWCGRDRQVLELIAATAPGLQAMAIGLTLQGQPRHPLYAPATAQRLVLALAQTTGPGASCGQRADEPWPAPRAATPFICT